MKNSIKLALTAAALATAASVQAQVNLFGNAGDLIIGFTGGANNYIADITLPTGFIDATTGALATPGHQNFSANFNASSASLAGYSSANIVGMNVGVVSSDFQQGAGPQFVLTSGAHTPPNPVRGSIQVGSGNIGGMSLGSSGDATVTPQTSTSWSQLIAADSSHPGGNANNFSANVWGVGTGTTGTTPMSTFGASKIVVEQLWEDVLPASGNGAWVLLGSLTIDFSGGTPSITFDQAAVPEPTTYGALAGAGLLVLSLRRQFGRKTA